MSDARNLDTRKFETRAIHAGREPDAGIGSVTVPIYQTSTYALEAPGEEKGFGYSRIANPTRQALEVCLASLEEAGFGLAFASGVAAEDAVFRLLDPGDHVLLGNDIYGGTRRLAEKVEVRFGLQFSSVDTSSLDQLAGAVRPNTRMIWVETPTNPTLQIADLTAISAVAKAGGSLLVVDNTFATPYLQRPIKLGADVVVHSTTKYLGGHSDVVGGAAVTSDPELAGRLRFLQGAAGAIPGPFDCWLVLRGLKTLGVRMARHCQNASLVAQMLAAHPKVRQVWYPGLAAHPGHEIAARQMEGFGGMVAFEVAGVEEARRVASSTSIFTLAESLGGVESLIGHPGSMSHASVRGTPYAVSDCLVRLSVGIEDAGDLIEDLEGALTF
jgi:cystathionine gamma-synthase